MTTADARWRGQHGIGRFATEVLSRVAVDHLLETGVSPASPLDPAYVAWSMRARPGEVFYSPGFNAGLRGRYRQLLTVHDLIHLDVPAETSAQKHAYYRTLVRPAVRRLGRVFTVSEFSRARVAEWAGLDIDQVVNVGVGCSFAPATEEELRQRGARARDESAVLFIGNGKPHKNLGLALRAIARLPDNYRLVTVGVDAPTLRDAAVAARVAPERVESHMGVSDEQLRALYLAASCVAMPSVYEGFGLPALEGAAVGTPTAFVAAAVGEAVGELGFRSSDDPNEYAYAVRTAIDSGPDIAHRLRDRASGYTWDATAETIRRNLQDLDVKP
ncbi:glycosyltransferase family 4 protein [Cellulomonas sp.]|uniref:glycosyltransferase family 4 protein n=1 Tax=Cellulomonas sp. TaxID=40001 RepID=UPI003BAAB82A